MEHISRRQFLRTATAGAALPYFVPCWRSGAHAPSRKITIGFIGVGDHGTGWNLDWYLKLPAARVLVVCDVDGWRMRKAKALVDAAYDNQDCAMTKDFREVLARPDIDAVMISTPDHWHTIISLMAVRAGKDVQCEKPTLTIAEGKVLIERCANQARCSRPAPRTARCLYHRMAEWSATGGSARCSASR